MDTGTGKLETLVGEVDNRKLQFCSNVTEMPDRTIYFTESPSAFTYEHQMGEILEARGRGSLFRRDPDGTVLTVVAGLYFANGVTPTADNSALVFAETQGAPTTGSGARWSLPPTRSRTGSRRVRRWCGN